MGYKTKGDASKALTLVENAIFRNGGEPSLPSVFNDVFTNEWHYNVSVWARGHWVAFFSDSVTTLTNANGSSSASPASRKRAYRYIKELTTF